MGIISEAVAAASAKELEIIILDAMNGAEWFCNRIIVCAFVKKHLYKRYLNDCNEAWINPNELIIKEFKDKE